MRGDFKKVRFLVVLLDDIIARVGRELGSRKSSLLLCCWVVLGMGGKMKKGAGQIGIITLIFVVCDTGDSFFNFVHL